MKMQLEKAEDFRTMHRGKNILVLPNAWDVPSARLFEDERFPAVATSSAGMMVSLGYPDGEVIGIDELSSVVRKIAGKLSVPLSADVVGGFGDTPDAVAGSVRKIIAAGAVGINIEDFVHSTKKLLSVESQKERLRAAMEVRETTGVPFVINARTDAYRFAEGDDKAKFDEAVRRGEAYRDLGVDCVYPMGLVDFEMISTYVAALSFPTNVMVRKGLPSLAELKRVGVARVSFGPSASYAAMGLLRRASREVLEKGTYESLVNGALTFDELNTLAVPKKTAD